MSKTTETPETPVAEKEKVTTSTVAKKEKKAAKKEETLMYIGPTIPNVVSKNTVFNNGLPDALEKKKEEMPVLAQLIVPVESLSEARKNLAKSNSAIGTCYQQVLSDLQKEKEGGNES
jgi:hypothetical protein